MSAGARFRGSELGPLCGSVRFSSVMVLQGFFDDSGNEPTSPIFVLAGFITTNQQWAAFSDEWQLALDEPPRLKYFKMAEAEHCRGQFSKTKGWINENLDARLLTLAKHRGKICHCSRPRVNFTFEF